MELALYCPDCGFYEKEEDNIGRSGDFFTSVSSGPLFGELLAFQFAKWLEQMEAAPGELWIVEAGAHDGPECEPADRERRGRPDAVPRRGALCMQRSLRF